MSVADAIRTHITHYGNRLRRSDRYDDMEPTNRVKLSSLVYHTSALSLSYAGTHL